MALFVNDAPLSHEMAFARIWSSGFNPFHNGERQGVRSLSCAGVAMMSRGALQVPSFRFRR
jgi:hypothetical protein